MSAERNHLPHVGAGERAKLRDTLMELLPALGAGGAAAFSVEALLDWVEVSQ